MLQQFGEIGFEKKKKRNNNNNNDTTNNNSLRCYAVTRYAVTGFTNNPSFTVALVVAATSIKLNPFAPGDFAEKCVLKLVEWFSGHCRAIKS